MDQNHKMNCPILSVGGTMGGPASVPPRCSCYDLPIQNQESNSQPHEEQKREEVSKCCGYLEVLTTRTDSKPMCGKCGKPFIPHTEEKCAECNPENYPQDKTVPICEKHASPKEKKCESCGSPKAKLGYHKCSPKTDKSWELEFDEEVQKHIQSLQWTDKVSEYVKTLVACNIQGFAGIIKKQLGKLPEKEYQRGYAEGEKNNLAKLIEECGEVEFEIHCYPKDHNNDITHKTWFVIERPNLMDMKRCSSPEEAVKNLLAALKKKKV